MNCLTGQVWLDVPVSRLHCLSCGIMTEKSTGCLSALSGNTATLSAWVEFLVRLLPVKHVASLTGLHGHTVKHIDYRRLQRE
ncbi:hypothetical protein WDV93_22940 [Pantoea ananatis]